MGSGVKPEIDPQRFATHRSTVRGFEQAFVYERARGSVSLGALLCVHGWPESKRIFWKVIEPLAAAGFDVIVPDLRGFGDSGPAPDGFYTPSHAHDLYALVHDHLGYESCVVLGGDMGGPVIQEMALRWPEFVSRMVLFNSPLPFDKERMAGIDGTRAPREAADYFVRQGTDADRLAAELSTPEARRHYIATFYSSRFWAHPGTFTPDEVDFHTEPFASAEVLRASFGGYETVFDPTKRSEMPVMGRNDVTPTLVLFGPSDHVIYPAFDKMAAQVFGKCIGPFLLRDCGHFVPWEAPDALVSATVSLRGT